MTYTYTVNSYPRSYFWSTTSTSTDNTYQTPYSWAAVDCSGYSKWSNKESLEAIRKWLEEQREITEDELLDLIRNDR